jgi:GNAT superfamily N-acetyltransferase
VVVGTEGVVGVETWRFREARPDEAVALGELAMRGLAHWGHDQRFPELVEDFWRTERPTEDFVAANTVHVLEDADGTTVGFYGLRREEGFVDLVYMFVEPEAIGQGHGRRLWRHAVDVAATLDTRMRVLSDPGAVGFYAAMGGVAERDVELRPGFSLRLYWVDLPQVGESSV